MKRGFLLHVRYHFGTGHCADGMSRSTGDVQVQSSRAQLRLELAHLGTEVERTRADVEQWRLAAMAEMQRLQADLDSVISLLRLEMRARYTELSNEGNK